MRTKRILVVGGGSAGWTAAAYLNSVLNVGDHKVAEISLIESPTVPRIGVGEATIPNINQTLAAIGIDELRFADYLHAFAVARGVTDCGPNLTTGESSHHRFPISPINISRVRQVCPSLQGALLRITGNRLILANYSNS